MRAGELLGVEVLTDGGHHLGKVHDIRLHRRSSGEWAIDGLIVGPGALGVRLGYAYGELTGPPLLASLLRRLGRRALYVRWEQVAWDGHGHLTFRGAVGDLGHPSRRAEGDD